MKTKFNELGLLLHIKGDGALEYIENNPRVAQEYIDFLLLEAEIKINEAKMVSLHMAKVISDNNLISDKE